MPESNTPQAPQKAADQSALTGLTKRQQLKKTNQNIFIWVTIAAVVLAFSIVALQFLIRQGLFNAKIISEQQKTSRALDESKKNVDGLKKNVDALLADTKLSGLRANPNDSSLQVVLDALPTSGDPTSFSNSLYNKILSRQGVTINAVSAGEAGGAVDPNAAPATATATDGAQPLPFSVSFVGNVDQLRNTLTDMEKSIRPVVVRQMNIAVGEGFLEVTAQGETYYLPRSTVKLGEKQVKP